MYIYIVIKETVQMSFMLRLEAINSGRNKGSVMIEP